MAKAREIPGLTTELPYGDVAARVLEVRVHELIEHSAGVLDTDDIERVHAMRVATRRLRAAIEIFRPCFPKDDGRRTLKAVKALADALGERRDRDVAIESLDAFAASMPAPDRPGIQSLVERFRGEQAVANTDLEPLVDPARLQEIRALVLDLAASARDAAGVERPEVGAEEEPEPEPETEPTLGDDAASEPVEPAPLADVAPPASPAPAGEEPTSARAEEPATDDAAHRGTW